MERYALKAREVSILGLMSSLCALAIKLYPKEFREEFGDDILASFEHHYKERRISRKSPSVLREEMRDVANLFAASITERFRRYSFNEHHQSEKEAYTLSPFKIVWKAYFAWQAEAEAAWLEDMSKQGYHFVEYTMFWYWFRRLPKARPYKFFFERRFRMNASETERFIGEREMDGWEFFKYFAGWYYFRKPIAVEEERI